jgi:hypothetical protein
MPCLELLQKPHRDSCREYRNAGSAVRTLLLAAAANRDCVFVSRCRRGRLLQRATMPFFTRRKNRMPMVSWITGSATLKRILQCLCFSGSVSSLIWSRKECGNRSHFFVFRFSRAQKVFHGNLRDFWCSCPLGSGLSPFPLANRIGKKKTIVRESHGFPAKDQNLLLSVARLAQW